MGYLGLTERPFAERKKAAWTYARLRILAIVHSPASVLRILESLGPPGAGTPDRSSDRSGMTRCRDRDRSPGHIGLERATSLRREHQRESLIQTCRPAAPTVATRLISGPPGANPP
jgi:hypothetical protein